MWVGNWVIGIFTPPWVKGWGQTNFWARGQGVRCLLSCVLPWYTGIQVTLAGVDWWGDGLLVLSCHNCRHVADFSEMDECALGCSALTQWNFWIVLKCSGLMGFLVH